MLAKIESACANTILNCFSKTYSEFMTHVKLQKIFYFSFGTHLAKYNALMAEHNFQAWEDGPVLPLLYGELKKYKDNQITELIKFEDTTYIYESGNIGETINEVVNKLRCHTFWELSKMTHKKDGPWFKTVKEKGYQQDIDFNLIRDDFIKHPIL